MPLPPNRRRVRRKAGSAFSNAARQRQEQRVHQLDAPPVVAQQRRQTAPDAEVDARLRVVRVDAVHVVALLIGDHLERQLVVVAQEERPLAGVGDRRRLREDVDDRVEVQIGLVRVEAVPVVVLGYRIPAPVRRLGVLEDDARVGVALGRIAPYVVLALAAARRGPPRPLKPRMLVGGVIDNQLRDYADAAPMGLAQEGFEIVERAAVGMDVGVVGDIVAVVAERRRAKGNSHTAVMPRSCR
jgi:hypothetical protein